MGTGTEKDRREQVQDKGAVTNPSLPPETIAEIKRLADWRDSAGSYEWHELVKLVLGNLDALLSAAERQPTSEEAFDKLHIESMVREWFAPHPEIHVSIVDGLIGALRLRLRRARAGEGGEK